MKQLNKRIGLWGGVLASILFLTILSLSVISCKTEDDDDDTPAPTATYTITISSTIENGSVSADKTSAASGATITLTLSAAEGYEFESLSVTTSGNESLTTTAVTAGTAYTFTMPESNVTVSATFKATAVTPQKTAGSISYATATVDKTTADSAFTNELTNTGDGAVSYASSNTEVATVDASTGEVSIVGAGTTTITATVTDSETYTYATKTASYTLTVSQASITLTRSTINGSDLFGSGSGTDTYASTFAVGEKIAVIYKNTQGTTVKTESDALTASDISNDGKTATISMTIEDADTAQNVTYIYPATMANDDGTVKTDALAAQDGKLATLTAGLDCCMATAAWDNVALPSAALTNQFALFKLTTKNTDGSEERSVSALTITVSAVEDNEFVSQDYVITPEAAATAFYVALPAASEKSVNFVATGSDSKTYAFSKTGVSFSAGTFYQPILKLAPAVIWNSSNISDLMVYGTNSYTKDGITLTGSEIGGEGDTCAEWRDYTYEAGIDFMLNCTGGFTFSNSLGKNFTKIEMTVTNLSGWDIAAMENKFGSGWPSDYDAVPEVVKSYKVIWTGSASSVGLLAEASQWSFGGYVNSIIFYLAE